MSKQEKFPLGKREEIAMALDELERVAAITGGHGGEREKVEVSVRWALNLVDLGRIAIAEFEHESLLEKEREKAKKLHWASKYLYEEVKDMPGIPSEILGVAKEAIAEWEKSECSM